MQCSKFVMACGVSFLALSSGAWAQNLPSLPTAKPPLDRSLKPSTGLTPIIIPAPPSGGVSSSVGGGPLETQTISWPDRVPVMFVDQIELVKDSGEVVTKAVRVRARVTQAPGTGSAADRLKEVVMRGTMQIKELEATSDPDTGKKGDTQRSGEVSWTSVMDPATGRLATIRSPLVSSFRTTGDNIAPPTTINAQGDVAGLAEAVELLYGENASSLSTLSAEEAAAEEGGAIEDGATTGVNDMMRANSGDESGRGAASTSGAGLPQSETDFSMAKTSTETEAVEAVPVFGTTTEGCPARVDLSNNTVVIQSKLTENGSASGVCSDTSERFPLQKTYTACLDAVDRDAGKAFATFRRYWVDTGGSSQYVDAECLRDTELSFDLVEDATGCSVSVNTGTMTATPLTQLTYRNRTGNVVVVDTCTVSATAAVIAITETSSSCSMRHDFGAEVSYNQTRLKYLRDDGVEVSVQSCADDGNTYGHVKISDASVCGADVNLGSGVVARQFRTRINVDGVSQYITECAVDASTEVALQSDKDACVSTFFHNVAAGQSFGSERLFHELYGAKEYVTSCQLDQAVTYTHQEETVSYSNNDLTKTSRPLTRLYFTAPVVGEVEVSGAQVRTDAPELPYVLQSSGIIETGAVEYVENSCNKYNLSAKVDTYLRSDNTTYDEAGAAAKPSSTTVDCSWQNTAFSLDSSTYAASGSCGCGWVRQNGGESGDTDVRACTGTAYSRTGSYAASTQRVRGDGQVILTDDTTGSYPGCATSCNGAPAECSATPPSNLSNTWYTEAGWN